MVWLIKVLFLFNFFNCLINKWRQLTGWWFFCSRIISTNSIQMSNAQGVFFSLPFHPPKELQKTDFSSVPCTFTLMSTVLLLYIRNKELAFTWINYKYVNVTHSYGFWVMWNRFCTSSAFAMANSGFVLVQWIHCTLCGAAVHSDVASTS